MRHLGRGVQEQTRAACRVEEGDAHGRFGTVTIGKIRTPALTQEEAYAGLEVFDLAAKLLFTEIANIVANCCIIGFGPGTIRPCICRGDGLGGCRLDRAFRRRRRNVRARFAKVCRPIWGIGGDGQSLPVEQRAL